MLISRALFVATVAFVASHAPFSDASSTARNPLKTVGVVRDASILTKNHKVNILSTFDLAFDAGGSRIRLSLEPNHDIIAENAVITYARADGRVLREEPLNREEHRVYKGSAWVKRGQRWDQVGWSRITVRRDGLAPLFEGAFTIDHNHHHIQLSTNYKKSRQELDPDIDLREDEYMVVFRDSDISADEEHMELKKRGPEEMGCRSDELGFNMQPEHPVFASMSRREVEEESSFWSTPISSMFGKRQIDNSPGGGNGAGVNLVQSIGSTAGCPTTRKVALVGVAADCTYIQSFNSTESARANIINQINAASNLYESTFNISLGLANLFVVERECPTSVQSTTPWNRDCQSNIDIQERLNLFSQWRGQQRDSNSHWTLLSTCNSGSAVGLAWLGQACTQGSQPNNSTAGSSEMVAGANVVIRTLTEWQVIAHETGHTFGAVHDCTSSSCANQNIVSAQQCCPLSSSTCDAGERFIMNPSTAQGITRFSPCTIGNICSALLRNSVKSNCLTNNRGVTTITGQQCGNGIVEEGEDCDCGGEQGCGDNACCDARTCKFKTGAVCDDSTEDCCRNCQLASSTTVCRASTGSCDPEETCTGSSPYCPEDKTEDDGSDCGNGLKCASGQCTSRDQQCKTVMGSYTQGNDTYACDNSNCMLSCASPEFGRGVCYGLQQNFLDGTDCGAGGKCQNGRCNGSSLGNEVRSWIDRNRNLVIGLASGIGALIVFSILGCIYRCVKRRRSRKLYATSPYVAPPGYGAPPGAPPPRRGTGGGRGPRGNGGPTLPNVAMNNNRGSGAPAGVAGMWQPGRGPAPTGAPIPPPPTYTRSASVRYA